VGRRFGAARNRALVMLWRCLVVELATRAPID